MRKRNYKYAHELKCLFFISIFTLALTSTGLAQSANRTGDKENSPQLFTLNTSIQYALDENNQIAAYHFALKKAQWDKRRAWSMLFPTISFSTRMTRIDDQTLAERDIRRYLPPELAEQMPQTAFKESYYSSIDLSMPLFNGMILNGLAIANANARSSEALHQSSKNEVIFQVISCYLGVLQAKEVVKLQTDYLALSELNYQKAERLYNAGRYSKVETLRWKVEYQQQMITLAASESGLRSAMTNFTRVLNLDMTRPVAVEEKIPAGLQSACDAFAHKTDAELLSLIQVDDNELIRMNASLTSADQVTRISKLLYRNTYTSYMPNMNLSYSYAWRENNTLALDDYSPKSLYVTLSIPLFNSFQDLTATISSYYEFKQNKELFDSQLQSIRFQLTETVNKLINLKLQRELAKTTVEFSANNYQIVDQQKEQGLVSNLDFIDAKLNLQNARLNEIHTNYDFISAMVELYYLLGRIDELPYND